MPKAFICGDLHFFVLFKWYVLIREIKFDVTWSYVKRQTAKKTSEFVFFSSNPSLNHINTENCVLLFATKTNIFTPLFKELKTDGKSFIFANCRLTNDRVTSNLISLLSRSLNAWSVAWNTMYMLRFKSVNYVSAYSLQCILQLIHIFLDNWKHRLGF